MIFRRDLKFLRVTSPVRFALNWGLSPCLLRVLVFVLWINLDSGWMTLGEARTASIRQETLGTVWSLVLVRILVRTPWCP